MSMPQQPIAGHRRKLSVTASANNLQNAVNLNDFAEPSQIDTLQIQKQLDNQIIEGLRNRAAEDGSFKMQDCLTNLRDGARVMVEDDFSLCFRRQPSQAWNWNPYLFLLWIAGIVLRYVILFPLRLLIKILAMALTVFSLWLCKQLLADDPRRREAWELWILQALAKAFVFAWTGVVRQHGVVPKRVANQIFVANHSTMLDWVVLMSIAPFCVVGQLHKSKPFIRWFQLDVVKSLNCIWFDRSEQKDRKLASQRIKAHIQDASKPRLLLFPEGTCVNNQYCVQFKKGAFELDAEVCPIAIKYDTTFADAYWISKERSFPMHMVDIMTSWAMVVDVYFLEPQVKREDETGAEFASRVKAMIANAAGLKNVEWNGYLKHYKPSDRIIEEQRKIFSTKLYGTLQNLRGGMTGSGLVPVDEYD